MHNKPIFTPYGVTIGTRNPTLYTNIKLNNLCRDKITIFDDKMDFLSFICTHCDDAMKMLNNYSKKFLVVYLPYLQDPVYKNSKTFCLFESVYLETCETLIGFNLNGISIKKEMLVPLYI